MSKCMLCPNECGVDRSVSVGLCHAPSEMRINRIAPHFYEEPPISGGYGSGAVFFGGCTMKCEFCQNYLISRKAVGKTYTPEELADTIKKMELEDGVHNINFVSPTHYSDMIKRTLDIYRPSIPIVYNTSGYEKTDILRGLEGYVDVYLPDFKYSDAALAMRLSGRKNYPEVVEAAIGEMLRQKTNRYDEDGIMQQGVIIRHLVLPGYVGNSLGVINKIYEKWGNKVTMSVMSQFTPVTNCKDPARRLKPIEYKAVLSLCEKLGFEDVFIQELTSAEAEYTPEFDIGGD